MCARAYVIACFGGRPGPWEGLWARMHFDEPEAEVWAGLRKVFPMGGSLGRPSHLLCSEEHRLHVDMHSDCLS